MGESKLGDLAPEDRIRLLQFICSFAWADLQVRESERQFVQRLMERLEFGEKERAQVAQWLKVPPSPEDVDPNLVPAEHKQVFLDTIGSLVASDFEISAEERESLELLHQLLR